MRFDFQECATFAAGRILGDLAPGSVHVYYGPLNPESSEISHLRLLLSKDELERAARFHFETNRNQYIFTRGSLRALLSSYLDVPSEELQFAYTEHGKPYLAGPGHAVCFSFNVSHTEGLVAFAFTKNRKIGVDAEAVRTNFKAEEIAQRFFSAAEREALRAVPAAQIYTAFFLCWTRKEAYIKARGEGLSYPLAQFDVSLAPTEDSALIATRPDAAEAGRWLLRPFAVPEGFAAAVAVEVKEIP